ncbi:MAG: tetratricopeptide repeat protein [Planctomycetaceae bacterium]
MLLREKETELRSTANPPVLLKDTTPIAKAESLINEMVEKNSGLADAYLGRGRFRLRYGVSGTAPNLRGAAGSSASEERKHTLELIAADAQKALELEPRNFEAQLLASRAAQQLGKIDDARRFAEACRTDHPERMEGHLQLTSIEASAGKLDKAIEALQDGIKSIKDGKDANIKRGKDELRWNLVNLSLDQHDLPTAEAALALIRKSDIAKPRLEYLDARVLIEKKDWNEALKKLDGARPALSEWPELAKQADFWLGSTYRALGNPDLQLIAFRKVVAVDPFAVSALAGVADALSAQGRMDEALEEYRKILVLPQGEQGSPIAIAQQVVLATLRQNEEKRDWTLAKNAVEAAARIAPESGEVAALRAEILAAQKEQKLIEQAEEILDVARKRKESEPLVWTTRIALAHRTGKLDQARALLDEAVAKFGDRPEFRLSRARMLDVSAAKKDVAQLRQLATFPDSYSEAEKIQLASSLASIAVALDDLDLARELGRNVAKDDPSNLQIRLFLFDLAVRQNQREEMQSLLAQIRTIEGDGSLSNYCSAVVDFVAATQGDKSKFDSALKSLAEVRKVRQNWSRVPLLTGEIEFQRGNISEATASYLNAIELGERSPQTFGRTVELLNKQQRFADSALVIRRLQEQRVPLSQNLSRMAAETSLGTEDYDRAVELAEEATASSSRPEDFIWHGRILSVLDRPAEAEKSLRKAVSLGPKHPEARIELIQFLVRSKRLDDAIAELAIAEREIDAGTSPLAIAHCYESVGKRDEAEKRFEAALAASPSDPKIVRGVSDFYLRSGKEPKAEELLNRLTSGEFKVDDDTLRTSRRSYALLLSVKGDRDSFRKADALIADNRKEFGDQVDDRRVKAIIYSTRSSVAERREAIDLLEGIIRSGQQSKPEDRFVLASLYVVEDRLPQAREQLVSLVRSRADNAQYLAALVRVLLRNNETSEAEIWLARLEKLPSASGTLPVIELRAAVLFKNGQYDNLLKLHNETLKAAKPNDLEAVRRWTAQQFESYSIQFRKKLKDRDRAQEFARVAESLYDALIGDQNDRQLLKVGFLVRQDRIDEALSRFEQHWKEGTPELVSRALVELQEGCLASAPHQERFHAILAPVIESKPDSPMRTVLADLSMWMGKYDEAIAHYREILTRNERHVVALNNLAILLGVVKQEHAEAQRLIESLMHAAGTRSVFLDSQAMLYLAADQPDRALETLIAAEKDAPSADVKFHQASAYWRLGRTAEAQTAFLEGLKLGLAEERLQRFEREEFRNLKAKLK